MCVNVALNYVGMCSANMYLHGAVLEDCILYAYIDLAHAVLYYISVSTVCVCVCVLGYTVRRALRCTLRGRWVAHNYTVIVNLFGAEYAILYVRQ